MDEARPFLSAEDFGRPRRYHLVGVGVGRGARAGLVNVDGKLRVQLALDHLLRRRGDRLRSAAGQNAKLAVGLCGRLLDQAEGSNEPPREGLAGDRKVQHGALGRCAVIGVGRDLHLTHGVFLDARPLPGHAQILVARS